MTDEIQFSPEELDYLRRYQNKNDERTENPNLSSGILVEQHAEKIPSKYAVLYEDVKWTWLTLNQECNKVANYFLDIGHNPGETVAIMIENTPQILSFPLTYMHSKL